MMPGLVSEKVVLASCWRATEPEIRSTKLPRSSPPALKMSCGCASLGSEVELHTYITAQYEWVRA